MTDSDNSFFIALGMLARSAAQEPSPIFSGYTNREALLAMNGMTYLLAPYTPLYHLSAPILDADGNVTAFRESSEDSVSAWFASAPPHRSRRETVELDEICCGTSPRTELANIRVPLFYLGAAGAFGDYGLYSTTQVSSADVTAHSAPGWTWHTPCPISGSFSTATW